MAPHHPIPVILSIAKDLKHTICLYTVRSF